MPVPKNKKREEEEEDEEEEEEEEEEWINARANHVIAIAMSSFEFMPSFPAWASGMLLISISLPC
jgi:CO dehydrogenase/acetyl-CoA synthase beta subunit